MRGFLYFEATYENASLHRTASARWRESSPISQPLWHGARRDCFCQSDQSILPKGEFPKKSGRDVRTALSREGQANHLSFHVGGPSQLETFDYKPLLNQRNGEDLPESVRMG